MKYLLAFVGAVILGYVAVSEWLDANDVDLDALWLADAHKHDAGDDHLAHLPHPWSTHDGWNDPT